MPEGAEVEEVMIFIFFVFYFSIFDLKKKLFLKRNYFQDALVAEAVAEEAEMVADEEELVK